MPFMKAKVRKKLSKLPFKIQSKTGKMVKSYSAFPKEKSALLMPTDLTDDSHDNQFLESMQNEPLLLQDSTPPNNSKKKSYQDLKENELNAWHEADMVGSYSSKLDLIADLPCCVCNKAVLERRVWCQTCSEFSVFCYECAMDRHQLSPLHSLIELNVQDCKLQRIHCQGKLIDPHVDSCASSYSRKIMVVSNNIEAVSTDIWFCQCNSEIHTLLLHNLWPATPTKPGTAVSITLLQSFVALQMEGKISFLSYCDAMSWHKGTFNSTVKQCLYRFIQTDSIDQFRRFRRDLSSLKAFVADYDGLLACSACPKKNGDIFYCVDANFGLVLKSSASKSVALPNLNTMFLEDGEVKEFVESYQDEGERDKECSNFQAGNMLRSKRKTNKLSVTGVLGMSCRHEYPKLFLNLFHGERMGYVVLLLQKLLSETDGKNLDIHILYDIACILKRHLMKSGTLSQYNFNFAVPAFHVYGHTYDCQVLNSVRRLDSFGLMDGELMERLWSYLRSFSKISKEMTPAHRVDFLTDALLHFGSIKMLNIGKTLLKLHTKAVDMRESCVCELVKLSKSLESTVAKASLTPAKITEWKLSQEEAAVKKPAKTSNSVLEWRKKYFRNLTSLSKEKSLLLMSTSITDTTLHEANIRKLEKKLKSIEKKRGVKKRWSMNDPIYLFYRKRDLEEKQSSILDALQSRRSERLFLLALKKRYADGSAVASRLSGQIGKTCTELKNLVSSYNLITRELGLSNEFIYEEVIKEGFVFASQGISQANDIIPTQTKHTAIEYFTRMNRAIEEVSLIETEMHDVLVFWLNQYAILTHASHTLPFGAKVLLNGEIAFVKSMIIELKHSFGQIIDVRFVGELPDVSNYSSEDYEYESDSSDSSKDTTVNCYSNITSDESFSCDSTDQD